MLGVSSVTGLLSICLRFSAMVLKLLVFIFVSSWVQLAFADRLSDSDSGRKLIASYLMSFAKHVHWPDSAFASPVAPFVICVLGSDPLRGQLDTELRGQSVGRRRFRTKLIEAPVEVASAGCHQVFISAIERPRIKEILQPLDNLTVLTVSDMEGFAASGGMIGFVGKDGRVAMHINRTVLLASGLDVAPALLRLSH